MHNGLRSETNDFLLIVDKTKAGGLHDAGAGGPDQVWRPQSVWVDYCSFCGLKFTYAMSEAVGRSSLETVRVSSQQLWLLPSVSWTAEDARKATGM